MPEPCPLLAVATPPRDPGTAIGLAGSWAGARRAVVPMAAASTVRGPGARRVSGGAALFAVSDALLGASRFVLRGRAAQVASAGVMPTYTAAQWLIHTGLERTGDPA
ncbi:lysoplasmalogenase family protein [Lentzea sp. NPDC004782]|uniref:lysoplasmalogenase family protein n=1 Tax=Lentzea sp. NPDC004782 TaxID=3154458 RepID=UPI0033BF93BF